MRKDRVPLITNDEGDWTSKWRRILCVFKNNTGLGKKVKRAVNRRARQKARQEIIQEEIEADAEQIDW